MKTQQNHHKSATAAAGAAAGAGAAAAAAAAEQARPVNRQPLAHALDLSNVAPAPRVIRARKVGVAQPGAVPLAALNLRLRLLPRLEMIKSRGRRSAAADTQGLHTTTANKQLTDQAIGGIECLKPKRSAHLVCVHASLHALGEGRGVVLHTTAAQSGSQHVDYFIDSVTTVGCKDEHVVSYSTPHLHRDEQDGALRWSFCHFGLPAALCWPIDLRTAQNQTAQPRGSPHSSTGRLASPAAQDSAAYTPNRASKLTRAAGL